MANAQQILDLLLVQCNEDYATKVVGWLEGNFNISWDDLKTLLIKTFSTKQFRLSIQEVECDDLNVEMWAENGRKIFVCKYISTEYDDEGFDLDGMKAKLLHELSHIIRQRNVILGTYKVGQYFSGREYPARAFEVAWILSKEYNSVSVFLKDCEKNKSKANDLLDGNRVLRDFKLVSFKELHLKFIKLCDRYTRFLYGFRKRGLGSSR